jgi:hypothetical protein
MLAAETVADIAGFSCGTETAVVIVGEAAPDTGSTRSAATTSIARRTYVCVICFILMGMVGRYIIVNGLYLGIDF